MRIGVLAVSTLCVASVAEAAHLSAPLCETTDDGDDALDYQLDELEVTGSLAPLQANQAARIVATIGRDEIAQAAALSVNDLLKLALGVDVRQRGAFGVQTDICIDGGMTRQMIYAGDEGWRLDV